MQENADNQSAQRETEHLSGSKTLKVGEIIIWHPSPTEFVGLLSSKERNSLILIVVSF